MFVHPVHPVRVGRQPFGRCVFNFSRPPER